MDRTMRERGAYVARYQFPTRGDKSVRAQSIRGRIAVHGLNIPANAEWRTDFDNELMTFPVGKHDDQVDMLGLIGQLLDKMIQPEKARRPEPMRGIHEMTLEEAHRIGRPQPRGYRI